jgi:hypothetical protein
LELHVIHLKMFAFIRHRRREINSPAKAGSALKRTKRSGSVAVCLSRLPFPDAEFIRWRPEAANLTLSDGAPAIFAFITKMALGGSWEITQRGWVHIHFA